MLTFQMDEEKSHFIPGKLCCLILFLESKMRATLCGTEHGLLFDVTIHPMANLISLFSPTDSKPLYLGFSGDHVKHLNPPLEHTHNLNNPKENRGKGRREQKKRERDNCILWKKNG